MESQYEKSIACGTLECSLHCSSFLRSGTLHLSFILWLFCLFFFPFMPYFCVIFYLAFPLFRSGAFKSSVLITQPVSRAFGGRGRRQTDGVIDRGRLVYRIVIALQ